MENKDQENFISNLKTTGASSTALIEADDIKRILEDNNFINLIKNIMKSPVMNDAYKRIFYYYSTNGEFDLEQENVPNTEPSFQQNLINDRTIYDYYKEFCGVLNNLDYSKLFIIMSLPESIKAFTFRFLKIVINSEGIEINNKNDIDDNIGNINMEVIFILLKAYLVFLVIHELNHFMKRFLNKNESYKICKTPEIKEYKEGGEKLIQLLFGHILIENSLNKEQANYILDINNWNKSSVYEFRREFLNIKKNSDDKCLVYLSSQKKSYCDHTKLFG